MRTENIPLGTGKKARIREARRQRIREQQQQRELRLACAQFIHLYRETKAAAEAGDEEAKAILHGFHNNAEMRIIVQTLADKGHIEKWNPHGLVTGETYTS